MQMAHCLIRSGQIQIHSKMFEDYPNIAKMLDEEQYKYYRFKLS